jgi:hypothetical protein
MSILTVRSLLLAGSGEGNRILGWTVRTIGPENIQFDAHALYFNFTLSSIPLAL